MAAVHFAGAALDDLRRLDPDSVPHLLGTLLRLEDDPEAGGPLGASLTGFHRLVVGQNTWRVVYRVVDGGATVEIWEIWAVADRRDAEVYAEAVERVRAATVRRPELAGLGDVVARLGRLAGGTAAAAAAAGEAREPVPGWLADRLVRIVGLPREDVAAMDLQRAVDLWSDYRSGRQSGQ